MKSTRKEQSRVKIADSLAYISSYLLYILEFPSVLPSVCSPSQKLLGGFADNIW